MHIKKLRGFKIETDLDEKLCRHLGRLNYVGVSEKKYRRKGWLKGDTFVGQMEHLNNVHQIKPLTQIEEEIQK